jgi:hypothetical protein
MRARSEPVRAFATKEEAVRFADRQLGDHATKRASGLFPHPASGMDQLKWLGQCHAVAASMAGKTSPAKAIAGHSYVLSYILLIHLVVCPALFDGRSDGSLIA